MPRISIVRGTLDELDALTALFDAYRVFYEQPSDLPRARTFLEARLRQGDAVIFLARGVDGEALGFAQIYPSFSSVSTAPIWILNDLYVAPAARGGGVGEALLGRARQHARETGALRLELTTAHTNTVAQALYERVGYRLDTVFRRYSQQAETD